MSNYKRKKKKQRKSGWGSSGRLHKHEKRKLPQTRNIYKRQKAKKIIVLAKSLPGKTVWWNRNRTTDWFVWSRYEKMKDAQNAMKRLIRKDNYPGNNYEFKIRA